MKPEALDIASIENVYLHMDVYSYVYSVWNSYTDVLSRVVAYSK